eukprot:m.211609 g.211609  ORF g.211609 m.211609 type:complete len:267 (+) comp15065_c0_seq2:377-1177(+)
MTKRTRQQARMRSHVPKTIGNADQEVLVETSASQVQQVQREYARQWPTHILTADMLTVRAYITENCLTLEQETSLLQERRREQYRRSSKKKKTLATLTRELEAARHSRDALRLEVAKLEGLIAKETQLRAAPTTVRHANSASAMAEEDDEYDGVGVLEEEVEEEDDDEELHEEEEEEGGEGGDDEAGEDRSWQLGVGVEEVLPETYQHDRIVDSTTASGEVVGKPDESDGEEDVVMVPPPCLEADAEHVAAENGLDKFFEVSDYTL